MKVPPYIDIIDIPDHAPLRPWIFPVSPIKRSTTTDAGKLEPDPQSQASVRASADPSLSSIFPTLTLKCVRNFETMAMRT